MSATTHWTDAQTARLNSCIDAGDTIAFWCSDAFGRPSNGGDRTIDRAAPGVIHRAEGGLLCGPDVLHATHEPHRWAGVRVWIVACRGLVGTQHDKLGCREREIIGEILPEEAISASVACRIDAARADLVGANLVDANLARANLVGANLARANLVDAYLVGADLVGANLVGANLAGANLAGADLARANLVDANLARAYLVDANLADANLVGAYLARANLARANLAGAYRPQSDITGWTADEHGYLGRS